MKKLCIALLFTLFCISLTAQNGHYDLRFQVHDVDCLNEKIYIDFEVKATVDLTGFNIADQNYRFSFNDDAIANPLLDQALNLNGFVPTSNPPTNSFYSIHSIQGSIDTIVSYNVVLAGGDGYPLSDTWLPIGRLVFDIVDLEACLGLVWHTQDPDIFPSTFISEKVGGTLFPAEEEFLTNLTYCMSTDCGLQEPRYSLRFNNEQVDCTNSTYTVDLQVQSMVPNLPFNIADQNLRFSFNRAALENPQIAQELTLSGLVVTSSPSTTSFYGPHTLVGSIDTILSYNVQLLGGDGYPVSNNGWVDIGSVSFDVVDLGACAGLTWHTEDPQIFPPCFVSRKKNNVLMPLLSGDYTNTTNCFEDECGPQGSQFAVRLQPFQTDCANNKYYVDLEVKSNTLANDFFIADQNYRFSFNRAAVTNPQIDQELDLSGFVTTANPPSSSFFSPHSIVGSLDTLVSYNVSLAGGKGYPVNNTNWTPVGRLVFDIVDLAACLDLEWHDFNTFPPTFVSEKVAGILLEVEEGSYGNATTCFEDECGAQSAKYDVRFKTYDVDCTDGEYLADIEIKANDPNFLFNVADQNYRLSFNDNAITNPRIAIELALSGFTQTLGPTTLSFYAPHTLTGSADSILSYNVVLAGGDGYPLKENIWTPVGRVVFDVVDANEPIGLVWHSQDPLIFPPTSISQKQGNTLINLDEGEYIDELVETNVACPGARIEQPLSKIGLSPVPVSNRLKIDFIASLDAQATTTIIDAMGRTVYQTSDEIEKGYNLQDIDLVELPGGIYLYTITFDDYRYTQAFTKLLE